jgi:hypothetical protein
MIKNSIPTQLSEGIQNQCYATDITVKSLKIRGSDSDFRDFKYLLWLPTMRTPKHLNQYIAPTNITKMTMMMTVLPQLTD